MPGDKSNNFMQLKNNQSHRNSSPWRIQLQVGKFNHLVLIDFVHSLLKNSE